MIALLVTVTATALALTNSEPDRAAIVWLDADRLDPSRPGPMLSVVESLVHFRRLDEAQRRVDELPGTRATDGLRVTARRGVPREHVYDIAAE